MSGRNAPVFIFVHPFERLSVQHLGPRHKPYKSGFNFYCSNTALNRIQKKEEKETVLGRKIESETVLGSKSVKLNPL